MRTLADWLADFDALVRPGPWAYARAHHHDGGVHGTHLVFGSMVHGEEVGSLPAVVKVMGELARGERTYGGKLTFFVGNPEAGLQGQRFLQSDLNRVFQDDPPDDHEGRRARLIRPILDAADVFIDLHQTIEPTRHAFYIFPFVLDGWRWARALATTRLWITRHPGQAFTTGAMCADEYVRARKLPGITIELSQRGFGTGGEERAYQAIVDALALADAIAAGTTTLEAEADAKDDLVFLETVHREPFPSDDLALRPGLQNFDEVVAGEVLSAPGTPLLVAPKSGMIVFPKYPPRGPDGAYKKPLPGEIYRIVAPLPRHPTEMYADALGAD